MVLTRTIEEWLCDVFFVQLLRLLRLVFSHYRSRNLACPRREEARHKLPRLE